MKKKILEIITNNSNCKEESSHELNSTVNFEQTQVDSADATYKAINFETRQRCPKELFASNYLRLCWPVITQR